MVSPFYLIYFPISEHFFTERGFANRRLPSRRGPQVRTPNVPFVPMQPNTSGSLGRSEGATFGQRRLPSRGSKNYSGKTREADDVPKEISWIPSTLSERKGKQFTDEKARSSSGKVGRAAKMGVETFGAGLERGREEIMDVAVSERHGRIHRRQNIRSGSKNAFRRL